MYRPRRPWAGSQRGAAALVVVMMLFFIMSLVAAYASRNLIFEQRTSANNYRSTQAFDAAEAGLEWAIAMLNGGRIDAACAGTADVSKDSFRDRYLQALPVGNPDGFIGTRTWSNAGTQTNFLPSCVRDNGVWICSCPGNGEPVLAAPAGTGMTPAFRVSFEVVGTQPGVLRVYSQGCSSFGTQCFAGAAGGADANAEVNALLGLAPSLTQTPAAALTVRGNLVVDASPTVVNADASSHGITVNAGGAVPTSLSLSTTPGSANAAASVIFDDPSLKDLNALGGLSPGKRMFLAAFGMSPEAYRVQAAVVRIDCSADCAAQLQDAAAQFPGRVLWIDGDLNLAADATLAIGSASAPVILVVDGDAAFAAGSSVTLTGMVYVRGSTWDATGSNATVIGAFVAEGLDAEGAADDGEFAIYGSPTIVFDPEVLQHFKQVQARQVLDFGSFGRVPGSWRDFR